MSFHQKHVYKVDAWCIHNLDYLFRYVWQYYIRLVMCTIFYIWPLHQKSLVSFRVGGGDRNNQGRADSTVFSLFSFTSRYYDWLMKTVS